jgi:hypothetical protein
VANPLKDIEESYDVASLQYIGEQIWPVLRWHYFDQIRIEQNNIKRKKKSKFARIIEFFYNWTKWFSLYDYFFYSDSELSTRRKINGKYLDRFMDPIIDCIGKDKCLLVEIPTPEHHSIKDTYTENITSYTSLEIISRIINLFSKKTKLENKKILLSIQEKYGLKINDEKIIKLYLAKKHLYKFLYNHYNLKAIFFDDSYRDIARLSAANELKIPTIDVQHGVIGQEHPAYNVYFKMSDLFRCTYLFTFGEVEKTLNNPPFLFKAENVYPVGSYYLDYINEKYTIDPSLKAHIGRYKKSVAVTLQKNLENELIEFVFSSAKLDEGILYLLVPRQDTSFTSSFSNVELVYEPNFYELMKYVDFHVTIFSSCAIEAPSLGVPNILVDIGGYAKKYYSNILNDPKITRYVDSPKKLVQIINTFKPALRKEIVESNKKFISTNYKENIRHTLKLLGFLS